MKTKKTVRLDFRCFGTYFSKENNFFVDLLREDYNVIIDEENPDFVIFGVLENVELRKRNRNIDIPKRIYLSTRFKLLKKIYNFLQLPRPLPYRTPKLKGNFVKIFYTGENVAPDMKRCDWAFSFCYDEEFKHPRHMRLPIYFSEGDDNYLIKRKINPKEKKEFCNFVYRNNVYYRNKFFTMLSKYKKIDSPGLIMNNMPNDVVAWSNDPRRHYGKKHDFLKKYRFTIAFENSITPGYITEKITHPMMAGSIPIYFGNPLAARDFNPKSFINVADFKNFNEAIKKVIEIDNNDKLYRKMLNEPWFKGNRKNKYCDREALKKRFRKIFG